MTNQDRAVLYARVSGDDRRYATSGIDSQLSDCRQYARDNGYEIVGEYYESPEKNTSGADWLPEIEKILELAQQTAFDVLIVREVDRLARNRFKQMSIENRLDTQGVRIEYVKGQFENTAEGQLLKGLMSATRRDPRVSFLVGLPKWPFFFLSDVGYRMRFLYKLHKKTPANCKRQALYAVICGL